MGRVAGALYVAGFVTTVAAILLPHSPNADLTGFWVLAAAMAVTALVLLYAPSESIPTGIYPAVMAFGTVIISLTLYFNGERHGGPAANNEVLYLWVALYAGYFFTRTQLIIQLLAIAGGYAVALLAIQPGPIGVTRWLITVGMVSVAASLVHALKQRNDRLVARLSAAARTDPLTGLVNRKGFDETLERELSNARRVPQPLALILCDIDNFKALNDGLGHPAGDAALIAVGDIALELVRAGDTMARIGGDEFAVILPNTDSSGASELVERLRNRLATLARGIAMQPLAMSFGVVAGRLNEQTTDSLVRAADRALYEAKDLGRDCTVIRSIEPSSERTLVEPGFSVQR
jgi:diguanylate cyclase (GGDEF)-like protein